MDTIFSAYYRDIVLVNILMFLRHIMYLLAIINVVECNFSSNIWLKDVCIAWGWVNCTSSSLRGSCYRVMLLSHVLTLPGNSICDGLGVLFSIFIQLLVQKSVRNCYSQGTQSGNGGLKSINQLGYYIK